MKERNVSLEAMNRNHASGFFMPFIRHFSTQSDVVQVQVKNGQPLAMRKLLPGYLYHVRLCFLYCNYRVSDND